MGAGVERVMRHLNAPSSDTVTSVFSDWETVAGELISKHTRPTKIVDGVLHLETDEPAWASEMRWMSEELLRRIQEHLGNDEVTEIVVHVAR